MLISDYLANVNSDEKSLHCSDLFELLISSSSEANMRLDTDSDDKITDMHSRLHLDKDFLCIFLFRNAENGKITSTLAVRKHAAFSEALVYNLQLAASAFWCSL